MGHAKSYHVPRESPVANALLQVTRGLDFRGHEGELSLQVPSRQLVGALGKMPDGMEADWNRAYRYVAAAMSQVSGAVFQAMGKDGASRDWSRYALALVERVVEKGLAATAFDRADLATLSKDTARSSRLQARRQQQHLAVLLPGGGAASSVLAVRRGDEWAEGLNDRGGGGGHPPDRTFPTHHANHAYETDAYGAELYDGSRLAPHRAKRRRHAPAPPIPTTRTGTPSAPSAVCHIRARGGAASTRCPTIHGARSAASPPRVAAPGLAQRVANPR